MVKSSRYAVTLQPETLLPITTSESIMSKTRQQSQSISEPGLSEELLSKICKQQAGMIGKQLEERFKQFESSFKSLVEQVNENKSKLQYLETKVEHIERMSKIKNLIVYGEEQAANETPELCENKIINFFQDKLELAVSPSDLDQCYRIGKAQDGKPRPILVQFLSIKTRDLIFKKKKMLKNTNYFMKEDLTASAVETLKLASEKYGKNNVWSQSGRIFANINGKKTVVNCKNLVGR
ncbi:unnamed protein product [Phaedon cochleariae]|uniref:Zinc finger DNA binding protein n=1 Tax=Phaedon cochleariae TaxID=80249 RepID=A0A9N9SIB5_PHACE|nr:unnamed protein product [Phaedon cochleariae]